MTSDGKSRTVPRLVSGLDDVESLGRQRFQREGDVMTKDGGRVLETLLSSVLTEAAVT